MYFLRFRIVKRVFAVMLLLAVASLIISLVAPAAGIAMLLATSLGCFVYLVAALAVLKHCVHRRIAARPWLSDDEFYERFYEPRDADPDIILPVRRLLVAHYGDVGGTRFWPEDRVDDVLHLTDLSRRRLTALVGGILGHFGLSSVDLAGVVWYTVDDIFRSVHEAVGRRQLGAIDTTTGHALGPAPPLLPEPEV